MATNVITQLEPEFDDIIRDILIGYRLEPTGIHGVTHWARVLENGLRVAEQSGGDVRVVMLFALYHDSCRINDDWDRDHGRRGADRAAKDRGRLFELDDTRFALLHDACCRHTDGLIEGDLTVQTCWDADRLDLGRVGITPRPDKLCTAAARQQDLIDWANARARRIVIPEWLPPQWLRS